MTSGIHLAVRGNARAQGGIIAQIDNLGSSQTMKVMLSASEAADGKTIELVDGDYAIRILLASGSSIQKSVRVDDGVADVVFTGPTVRAAPVTLQELASSATTDVMLDAIVDAKQARLTQREIADSSREPASGTGRLMKVMRKGLRYARRSIAGTRRVGASIVTRSLGGLIESPASVSDLSDVIGGLGGVSGRDSEDNFPAVVMTLNPLWWGHEAWESFASGPGFDVHTVVWPLEPESERDGVGIWKLDPPVDLIESVSAHQQIWARVQRPNGVELISVPHPWGVGEMQEYADIHLAVDQSISGRAAATIAVSDKRLETLLTYLAPGHVRQLSGAIDELSSGVIHRLVFNKGNNILAACAAAYAGLAVADRRKIQKWEQWVWNLRNFDQGRSDGCVLEARLLMIRNDGSEDREERMLKSLADAFDAGIPYFSVGVQLMRDMLLALSVNHEAARELLEKVAPVAARTDPYQLFTCLRYPDPS